MSMRRDRVRVHSKVSARGKRCGTPRDGLRGVVGCWVVMGLSLLAAGPAEALDLLEAFELAKANDPVYRAATFERLAEDSSLRIAWSSLLPNASAEAGYTKSRQDIQSSDNALFQVGSTSFANPHAPLDILEGIEKFMATEGIEDINELIGIARLE